MYDGYGLLIDGSWRHSVDGKSLKIASPATETEIGTVPAAGGGDIDAALASVASGFEIWSQTPAWDRASILRRTSELLRARCEEAAHLMCVETGKPLAEARAEISASADQFEWYGEEAKRVYGQLIPGRASDERLSVVYQPVGPCLALSAWNFPALLPARKIAAALAAGCSVIARPASEAPGSCMLIAQALMDAGLPPGVLCLLTGTPVPMVEKLIASPVIRKVSLTGSVPVGKKILRHCADGVKKVTLELGGHAPVIVHADFDPTVAAAKLAATKFRNCGQVCISPSRFYVHASIAKPFEAAFADYARNLVVGDGRKDGVTTGPMIRASAVENALRLVEDARSKGARLLAGGERPESINAGHFLLPTVLADVPDSAAIMSEEPFAPVAPIAVFTDVEEVIARANSTPFGLAAYVFSHDGALASETADALEAGMIGVNETLLATAEAPFGGVKQSGFGREGGSLGVLDYLVPKYIRHKLVRGTVDA